MNAGSNLPAIVKVQRFSLHDGPGIRTTVFLKGCPLRCGWCCNPESQSTNREMLYYKTLCTKCGLCRQACPIDAINKDFSFDRVKCTSCGKCAEVCPNQARYICGTDKTIESIVKECLSDIIFYHNSNGGVTISGGEPVMHKDFVLQLIRKLKVYGIQVGFETCGYVPNEDFAELAIEADLVLYDLKTINKEKARKYLNQDVRVSFANHSTLIKSNTPYILRYAIIPDFNDDLKDIEQCARYLKNNRGNLQYIELLPFHVLGRDKYIALDRKYSFEKKTKPDPKKLEQIKNIFITNGLKTYLLS